MKIDTDLRLAIKAAAAAQPNDNYEDRRLREQKAIADFLKRYPQKAKRLRQLSAAVAKHEKALSAARSEICQSFGLRIDNDKETRFEFANCGNGTGAFVRAGGKIDPKRVRYTAEQMMAKIAAATPKEGAAIIKSLGIIWE